MTILQIIRERQRELDKSTELGTMNPAVIREQCRVMDRARDKLEHTARLLMAELPRELVPVSLKKGWTRSPPQAGADVSALARFLEEVALATTRGTCVSETIYMFEFAAWGFASSDDGVRKLRKLEGLWLEALRLEIDNDGAMLKVRYYAAEVN
jgi:hypothetical protein